MTLAPDVLDLVNDMKVRGEPFALATVVRTVSLTAAMWPLCTPNSSENTATSDPLPEVASSTWCRPRSSATQRNLTLGKPTA